MNALCVVLSVLFGPSLAVVLAVIYFETRKAIQRKTRRARRTKSLADARIFEQAEEIFDDLTGLDEENRTASRGQFSGHSDWTRSRRSAGNSISNGESYLRSL